MKNTNTPNGYQPVIRTVEELNAAADRIAEELNNDPAFVAAVTDTTQETGRFKITDERSADWLLKKLADIDAEKERIRIFARARTAELDADAARLTERFGEELKTWAQEEAARRRRKTVTLPNGSLSFRTAPPRLVIADAYAANAHAAAEGIAQKTTFDTAAYREAAETAFKTTGELWPGMDWTKEQETFTVRFPKGKETPQEE